MKSTFERLQTCLSRLPGVGRRSAERMAVHLVADNGKLLRELRTVLDEAVDTLQCCSRCGSITSADANPCRLCTSPNRDDAVLCVVEDPNDILLIERSAAFGGRYHAMHGKLSPMKGAGAAQLRTDALLKRVREEGVKEVILALSTDVEGDATASYLSDLLTRENVTVSRLAFGLPAGSGIVYSDPVTLAKAIGGRQPVG